MAYMITLHQQVSLEQGKIRDIKVSLTEEHVAVTLSTVFENSEACIEPSTRTMPWKDIEDIESVANIFDLEPVRVFKVLAGMLATAYKHAVAIKQIIAESKE